MLRKFSAAALALAACASASFAQTQAGARAEADHSTSVKRQDGRLDISSGTRLSGELQNTLDVSRARVGDRVVLKTTQVTQSAGLSAEGGSTLSLNGGDLRLEKGATFRLTINQSARVGGEQ